MPSEQASKAVAFDDYAEVYDTELNRGLSVTGEDKLYFVRKRILWLSRCLQQLSVHPKHILDYGCGTGCSTPLLHEILRAESVIGVDSSVGSLRIARQAQLPCDFFLNSEYRANGSIDLVYCNGVFHHIPPAQRITELAYIMKCLRAGGLFAFWENNPWNPGTHYVMSRIPFDRDAIKISPTAARRLLRQSGFDVLRTDFLFFFPRFLGCLRWMEPFMSGVPVGGQYLILCRHPAVVEVER